MQSQTFTVPPILGCLKASEDYLRKEMGRTTPVIWTGITELQKRFVERFSDKITEINGMSDVLSRIAHKDHEVINQWLKNRGFDIRINKNGSPSGFCVASVLDILVEWLKEGEKTTIARNDTNYPAVTISSKNGAVVLTGDNKYPIASFKTKGEEIVFMMKVDEEPVGPLGLADLIHTVSSAVEPNYEYSRVTFPMIDYDQEIDISWIEGLKTGESLVDFYIDEAKQQTKFRMNEVGARAQSAAAMTSRCLSFDPPKEHLFIDGPFLLWIERDGIKTPIFAGVFAEDTWKEPRDVRQY